MRTAPGARLARVPGAPKTPAMGTTDNVAEAIEGSNGLVRAAGRLPLRTGACALALALGRVAGRWGLPLEDLLELARVSRAAGDVAGAATPLLLPPAGELN